MEIPKQNGGRREGAGRKVGAVTVITRKMANEISGAEINPLIVMQSNMLHYFGEAMTLEDKIRGLLADRTMNGGGADADERRAEMFETFLKMSNARDKSQKCAVDLAPYVHARITAVAIGGLNGEFDVARFTEGARDRIVRGIASIAARLEAPGDPV